MTWILLAIALGTLASEDLTCITTGQLIRQGHIHWSIGLIGCVLGIYSGDLGLYLAGRTIGRRAIRWPFISKRLPAASIHRLSAWFDRNAATATIAARFLPGTRLPLYFSAGTLGRKGLAFA